jgi:SIR2-like domain
VAGRFRRDPSVGFLVGSGVSCAAGLPSVGALTSCVLSDDPARPLEPPARRFLQVLKRRIEPSIDRFHGRAVNYEDLYYVAGQIGVDYWEYENPATVGFVDDVLSDGEFQAAVTQGQYSDDNLDEAARRRAVGRAANEALQLIKGELRSCLGQNSIVDLSVLEPFSRAACDPWLGGVEIFSLNHDLAIEHHLHSQGIAWESGFPTRDGEVSFWDPGAFERSAEKVHLFKLHGSLDWWRFPDFRFLQPRLGRTGGGPYHQRNWQGNEFPHGAGPAILVGTFNKMLGQALGGPFLDLLCLFRRRLFQTSRLVMVGYGFGDKGVNGQLVEWLDLHYGRAVWVHPKPSEALEAARGAMSGEGALGRAIARGDVVVVEKRFEDTTWAELAAALLP